MSGSSSVLDVMIGGGRNVPSGPPAPADMIAVLAAAQRQQAGPPLRIRRYESDEGPAYWRWDCVSCGEYGGGRHHQDAVSRALRHCAEHPQHRSSLLPPARCRQADRVPVHPMLFAVDDDPPPPPLSI